VKKTGEISPDHLRSRNHIQQRRRLAKSQTLVVSEEERPVLDDGPAQGGAKLILLVRLAAELVKGVFALLPAGAQNTGQNLLRTGAADVAEISVDNTRTVRGAGLQVLPIPDNSIIGTLFMGNGNPALFAQFPSSKKQARQALTLAINRQEIVDAIFGGGSKVPARYPIVPDMVGYDTSWVPDPYDPAAARQLLAEAGYRNGFSIKYWSFVQSTLPFNPRMVEAIAGFWAAVGVKADIAPVDFVVVRTEFAKNPQEGIVGTAFNLYAETSPVPFLSMTLYYGSRSAGGFFSLLPTKEMDDLLGVIRSTLDQGERARAIRAAIELEHSEYVTIPLAIGSGTFGAASDIGGWEPLRGVVSVGLFIEKVRKGGR